MTGGGHEAVRVQFAFWVTDGAVCAYCKRPYTSVDDMINRQPRMGGGFGQRMSDLPFSEWFVDDECYPAYAKERGTPAP